MNRRSWVAALVLVAVCCSSASAWVFQWPISPDTRTGQAGILKIRGKSLTKRSASVVLEPGVIGGYFVFAGAKLLMFNTNGGTACVSYSLPPSGWTSQGGSFTYTDRHRTLSPVTKALIPSLDRFTLKASASQPIDFDVTTVQGSVAVEYKLAIGRICGPPLPYPDGATIPPCSTDADCGGVPGSCQDSTMVNCENFIDPVKDGNGSFVSKTAEPITACPTPPPGCSPSGAFLDLLGE